ncbi:MAG: DUF2309 domain-containing protein [Bacteroidia bacterium]|nr:DUF2309 domain-containing protein [Bacteroidia bacterium]
MKSSNLVFHEQDVLHNLKHYLPAQAPLKDFIHHNTLHAFQDMKFDKAIHTASEIFGYKVCLSLFEYRDLFRKGQIREDVLENVLKHKKPGKQLAVWRENLLYKEYNIEKSARIGQLRSIWKKDYYIDLDLIVHPLLYRIICSYLDQGISIWKFPVLNQGFLSSIREMERNTFASFFKTQRARGLLFNGQCELKELLHILVGDEKLYSQYLFDQQFTHPGWSGMVSFLEDSPDSLIDKKSISLKELITFELLLEIDAMDSKFGQTWAPLCTRVGKITGLFEKVMETEHTEVLSLWQEAYEWSYYDQVLAGVKKSQSLKKENGNAEVPSFQALLCIDDRECSLRRYLEKNDPKCQTFGTPGFFGVEFYYKPEHGNSVTKQCPAPVTPGYLIKEVGTKKKNEKEVHFSKHPDTLFRGLLISQTLGFWSALKLAISIFRPSISPATSSSFRHMDEFSRLTIENESPEDIENGLQVGFTIEEMTLRVEGLLRSIGLIHHFAPVIYVVAHGSTSVNNTHYAGYDCGACSGRPGSVNARVISYMANHPKVRENLRHKGIIIPEETQFAGCLHDTTRDDITFYDEKNLSPQNSAMHREHKMTFQKALDFNARERSRRFEAIDTSLPPEEIHEKVRRRSVSLFEPRPELNHATNALCFVGRRNLTNNLFLDRRSFLNSYDYQIDPEGKYLTNILNAVAPVCGGINLEYYFSRVDNHKLGAGTKLAHNVMGLFGVANGIDGDLRPGLPSQMVEVHDPIRLMVIVEHYPEVVLETIQRNPATFQWFMNDWIHLTVVHPETTGFHVFRNGIFHIYEPLLSQVNVISDISDLLVTNQENFPVYLIQ